MNIEALCAAPPEALAHSPSQMPLSCPVAPGRPKLMPGCGPAGRRALAHADTPNTSPGCRSCASAPSPTGARPRRRAADLAALPKRISARRRAADHAALRALAHVQRAYEEAVRVVLKVCALARRRAPSPAGARPRLPARARRRAADLAALPKRTSHVAGLQTSPRFAPSHTLQRPYEETVRVVSTVLLGTSHILRSILRRILRHVLHVQRGRRRACVGPGVSRRWKTTRNDEDRHASFAAPKTPYATSFTCSSFTCRPRQWPKRAEDVSKTVPGPAASTTGSKSIAGR